MKWYFEWLDYLVILRVTTCGVFSLDEQQRMFDEILSLDGWQTGTPILFDNRRIEMKSVNSDVIRKSVQIVQDFNRKHSNAPIAGVVGNDINFGFGRQFELIYEFVGGATFRLFTDENVAIDWLRESLPKGDAG